MTFQSPSLSSRKGLAVVGSQSVLFTQNLHQQGHTFCASPSQAGCVIVAEPGISAARAIAMDALAESRSVLFTHPGVMATCGRELSQLAIAQRLFIGLEATLLGQVPVQSWASNQNAASLTGFFGGAADSVIQRMTQRAETTTEAEAHLHLQQVPLEDVSGKVTLARAQILHGLWQGFNAAPTVSRQSLEALDQADIARLRRWGMVLRFGFTLTAKTIQVGPTAFANANPLANWQGQALAEATATPASLLLTQLAPLAAQLAGLSHDLTLWQQGTISRKQTARPQSAAQNAPVTCYLRANSTQRTHILAHSTPILEQLDDSGTWQAIVTTKDLQAIDGPSTICLPVLGEPTEAEARLRLVA